MTDEHGLDLTRFPELVENVLDLMPNGDLWRERFAAEPGLSVRPEDDGWVTVLHHGDRVFQFHPDILQPDAERGEARAWVDGREEYIDLLLVPREEL